MNNNKKLILKEVLYKVNPKKDEIDNINLYLKNFTKGINNEIKKERINAELFVGGSYAKGTMIKKGVYDIDLFLRFNISYKDKDISKITEKILNNAKINYKKVHGSRDYFKINASEDFFIELIPVIKIKKPEEAENITDLSYFHVIYTKKRVKEKKIIDDIKIMKAFCYAQKCYGAESYINGLSGYAIELLVYYYGGFLKTIKAITKIKEKKIIDIEKFYKNKNDLLINMNSSKMQSPIILIDPTFKERNALAALSQETFQRLKDSCKKFLKKPSIDYFKEKKLDINKLKEKAKKKGLNFVAVELTINKEEGDIAGTKLLKFFNYLTKEIKNFYDIDFKIFEYGGKKFGKGFILAKPITLIEFMGPSIKDEKNCKRFKQRHKKTSVTNGRLYSRKSFDKPLKDFLNEWKLTNSQKIFDMGIIEMKIKELDQDYYDDVSTD